MPQPHTDLTQPPTATTRPPDDPLSRPETDATDAADLHVAWKIVNAIPIALIKIYRAVLSPYFGSGCRFEPTCSAYGLQAFQTHNFFRALYLTVWRILRCNPFVKGGYDPVPASRRATAARNHQC